MLLFFQFFLSGESAPIPPTPAAVEASGVPSWWWAALEITRKRRRKRLLELKATKEGEPEKVVPKPGKRKPAATVNKPASNPPSYPQPVRMSRLAKLEDAVLFGLPCDDPMLDAIAAQVGGDGDEVERMTRANVLLSRLTDGAI